MSNVKFSIKFKVLYFASLWISFLSGFLISMYVKSIFLGVCVTVSLIFLIVFVFWSTAPKKSKPPDQRADHRQQWQSGAD